MTLPDALLDAHHKGHVYWPKRSNMKLESGVPLLVFCEDWVRWWSLEDIRDFELPDYWREDVQITPFASNPYGDYWAFITPDTNDRCVALVAHDLNESRLYAPSFEGFLYRKALDGLAEVEHPDDVRRRHERASVEALVDYVPKEWLRDIQDALELRPLREENAADIARARLAWPKFDTTIPHELPLPYEA